MENTQFELVTKTDNITKFIYLEVNLDRTEYLILSSEIRDSKYLKNLMSRI